MKLFYLVCLMMLSFIHSPHALAQSAQQPFVKGQKSFSFLLGRPLEVRYQQWLSFKTAFDVGVGTAGDLGKVAIHADYLTYFLNLSDAWNEQGKGYASTHLYWLVGGLFGVSEPQPSQLETSLSVRGGTGVEYILPNHKWGIRGEFVVGFNVIGDPFVVLQGGVGVSYYLDSGVNYKRAKNKRM